MNDTIISNETTLHEYYGVLTEVNYYALLKLFPYVTEKQMIAYCTNVCYGSNFNTLVIPSYISEVINTCNNTFANQDQELLIDYFETFLKNPKGNWHLIRNRSIFQRFFISTFLPSFDVVKNRMYPNSIESDYMYYLIKLVALLPYHQKRLGRILNHYEQEFKFNRNNRIKKIKKEFDREYLTFENLKYIFNTSFLFEKHLLRYFILSYIVYQVRKHKQLLPEIEELLAYLASYGLEPARSHIAEILDTKYTPMKRSIIPYAIF